MTITEMILNRARMMAFAVDASTETTADTGVHAATLTIFPSSNLMTFPFSNHHV